MLDKKKTITSDTTYQISQQTHNVQYVVDWTSVNRGLTSSWLGIPSKYGSLPD